MSIDAYSRQVHQAPTGLRSSSAKLTETSQLPAGSAQLSFAIVALSTHHIGWQPNGSCRVEFREASFSNRYGVRTWRKIAASPSYPIKTARDVTFAAAIF